MKINKVVIFLWALVALSGCTVIENFNAANKLKLLNHAKKSCIEYGFKESTDSFSSCVQKEINEIKGRHALASAAKKVKDS